MTARTSNRLDWPAIKDRIDLEGVIRDLLGPSPKRNGSRPAWCCPFHDDHDPSFTVDDRGWRCWACGIGGDAAAFVMKYRKIDFPEAIRWLADRLGIAAPPRSKPKEKPKMVPTTKKPPAAAKGLSESEAMKLVEESAERLWSPEGASIRKYLIRHRGLTEASIRFRVLGWTPGVSLPTSDGARTWRAEGILIPWFEGNRLVRVKIRQPKGAEPKYVQAYTTGAGVYPGADEIDPDRPLVVVEGEFDAILLGDLLGSLASVITTGGASSREGQRARRAVLRTPRVFAAHDADEAGDNAATTWGGPEIRVRPPVGKDWTEAWRSGVDLRRWWVENHFPEVFDAEERAAIMEHDGGLTTEEAEEKSGLGSWPSREAMLEPGYAGGSCWLPEPQEKWVQPPMPGPREDGRPWYL